MQLTRLMVPAAKYNIKCPYTMVPEGIAVHNTANKASAMAEVSYMVGNNNTVSYHYAIDDYRIVQGIEDFRNAFHAGDGRSGRGNRKMISIEICYSTHPDGELFSKAEKLAAKFIAYKLKEYGWGIDKVYKHQDFSKKYCPHKTLDLGWERFLNLIRAELGTVKPTNTSTSEKPIAHVTVTANELNIRSGAGVGHSKVAVAKKGGEYDVYEIKGDWGRINGGWFNLDYTTYNSNSTVSNSTNYTVKINTDSLNIRSDAGTTNPIVGSVKKNQVYTIVEEKNGWGKLKSGAGWIKLSYTVKTSKANKPTNKNLSVGSKVKLKTSATKYSNGKTIPDSVKGKTYTVRQIGTKMYPSGILLKEIMSWVNRSDLEY